MKIRRKLPHEFLKCTAKLRGIGTHWGLAHRKRAGKPLDICDVNATFFVDEQPRCQNHAAQDCLRFMLGEQDAPNATD